MLSIVAFVSSCGTDGEDSKVTVTLKNQSDLTAVMAGQQVNLIYTLTADVANKGELGKFSVQLDGKDIPNGTRDYSKKGADYKKVTDGKVTDTIAYTVAADAEAGDINLTATAIDGNSGASQTKTWTITVKAGVPAIVTATGKTATYNSMDKNSNFIFSLDANAEMVGASANKGQLAFVWQNSNKYSIVSPNNPWITQLFKANNITYNVAGRENTKIQRYTGNWDDLTEEKINALTVTTETANGGNGVNNLSAGDIIIYETQDGRKGALKVGANAKITKSMTADLKYQAPTAGK